jgi:hypothetical protein
MPDQAEILEHHANAAAEIGKRLTRGLRQLLAEQANTTAGGALGEIEKFQQRRLSGSRRAGEEIETALSQSKIEIAQNLGARAIAQPNTIEFGNLRQVSFLLARPCDRL